jgi:hypothetical protein
MRAVKLGGHLEKNMYGFHGSLVERPYSIMGGACSFLGRYRYVVFKLGLSEGVRGGRVFIPRYLKLGSLHHKMKMRPVFNLLNAPISGTLLPAPMASLIIILLVSLVLYWPETFGGGYTDQQFFSMLRK